MEQLFFFPLHFAIIALSLNRRRPISASFICSCFCSINVGRQGRGVVIEGFPNEPIVATITEHIKGRMAKMRDGEMKGR